MAGTGRVFCSQACFGKSRRKKKPPIAARRAKKAAYDAIRRVLLADEIKAEKREYYKRAYDPAKAAKVRKKRMAWHVAYCRRYYADPKRKAAKVRYDSNRRAAQYGEFAGAFKLLVRLKREVNKKLPDKYERAKARGYYDRPTNQQRKRDAQVSRW